MKYSWLATWIASKRNKGSFDTSKAGSNPLANSSLAILAFIYVVSSGVAL